MGRGFGAVAPVAGPGEASAGRSEVPIGWGVDALARMLRHYSGCASRQGDRFRRTLDTRARLRPSSRQEKRTIASFNVRRWKRRVRSWKRSWRGPHALTWDGRTSDGSIAASGTYWYMLRTAEGETARSMVLLK